MNKLDSILHSGWMVKSPPHQDQHKKLGSWKLFQPKWKRRFFVLFKPAASLPEQFVLNYYGDEQCRKRKGHIDLEQCEQIIESLDVGEYPNVLSIKTIHKGKERVYFLATETEDDMITWVQNLCYVCGMKQEENPTDIPGPPQPPMRVDSHRSQTSNTLTSQPRYQAGPNLPSNNQDSPYLFISQCHSGQTSKTSSERHRSSVDSIPDELAPPPPPAKHNNYMSGESITDAHYDHPRSCDSFVEDDGVYKTPPSRNMTWSNGEASMMYDVPLATRNGFSRERFSSERSSSDMKDVFYDVPPRKSDPSVCYDTPPLRTSSLDPKVPARPQRHMSNSEAYQNIPYNSKCYYNTSYGSSSVNLRGQPPRPAPRGHSKSYSLKTSSLDGENLNLNLCPPPPCGSRDNQPSHGYVNAPALGSNSVSPDNPDDLYVPMEGPTQDTIRGRLSADQSFVDAKPYNCVAMNEAVYTDMSKPGPCAGKEAIWPNQNQADTYSIFGTEKTRSFKKVNNASLPVTQPRLPRKKQASIADGSSSSDEDGDIAMTKQGMRQILPAPGKPDCGELKYLDLRLDDTAETPSGPPPSCEYREIDFVKTNALRNVKNARVLE
ncbi:GRB2-associated-binding protein 2 isoform X2 [Octopus sinensis]|uniref:GRB2-associated-binding protein 2 isoform X2 n=1 Tax=Octopus sinensis TaxID=2607531 RepID=A0A6P7T043_9MOLL|nr:GRB2-associated-binding protein 2 isoform X2 [Octopus sinensis]